MTEIAGLLLLFLIAAVVLTAVITAMIAREIRRPPRHTAGYAVAHGLACDPGERSLDFDEWMLDLPGGARLPVWDISNPRGGDGPAVILLHGWGESRIDSLARIDPYLPFTRRFILYDLRGHGDTENSLCRLGSNEHRDLLALIERAGLPGVLLAGFSMGAAIAIRAAAGDDPAARCIDAIIAVAPSLDFGVSLNRRLRAAHHPSRPFTDLAMASFRLRGLTTKPLLEAVSNLSCPILVISSTDDPMSTASDGRRLAEAAPAGELVVIPGDVHELVARGGDAHLAQAIAPFVETMTASR